MNRFDITHAIDWMSIKLTGIGVGLCAITGNSVLMWLGGVATASTIVYNGIRIYKELKRKQ